MFNESRRFVHLIVFLFSFCNRFFFASFFANHFLFKSFQYQSKSMHRFILQPEYFMKYILHDMKNESKEENNRNDECELFKAHNLWQYYPYMDRPSYHLSLVRSFCPFFSPRPFSFSVSSTAWTNG